MIPWIKLKFIQGHESNKKGGMVIFKYSSKSNLSWTCRSLPDMVHGAFLWVKIPEGHKALRHQRENDHFPCYMPQEYFHKPCINKFPSHLSKRLKGLDAATEKAVDIILRSISFYKIT
ncbi:hypothetical protein PG989_014809, partial [Apiospora arundinis]